MIKAPSSVYWALRDVVLAMAACTVSGVVIGVMIMLLAL